MLKTIGLAVALVVLDGCAVGAGALYVWLIGCYMQVLRLQWGRESGRIICDRVARGGPR